MNKKYLTLLFLLLSNFIFSQDKVCNCLDELENTSKLIENAKSYKVQIRGGNREKDFKNWKEEIKGEIANDTLSNFFCVGYLQKYISFIKDRHNQIYIVSNNVSSSIPSYPKAIDTTLKSKDKVSGIYHAGREAILVKKENDSTWFGITLNSNSEEWARGKIRLKINKTTSDKFELFEFYENGLLLYQKEIDISNGRIYGTFWNKDNKYFFNKNHEQNFVYEPINPEFDYIGLKTLSRTKSLMNEANTFYTNNLNKLTKENLVIDLRNNGGGSLNQAKPLLKSLKRNKEIQRIYVLINFKTASASEIVALKLKEDKRTILVGENSRGMLEYGYGNKAFSSKTNCFEYNVVLSTQHIKGKFSNYEYIGIEPDIKLDNTMDWIEQIVSIEKKKK